MQVWWRTLGVIVTVVTGLTPCLAQHESARPRRTVTEGVPGVGVFTPERWGIVGVTVANPTEGPVEVLSAHHFASDASLQFARRLWVPPQARRSSWYPLLPPRGNALRGMNLEVKSFLIDRADGRESFLRDAVAGGLVNEGLLPGQRPRENVPGQIAHPDDLGASLLSQVAVTALQRSPRISDLDLDTLPPTAEALHGLDHLILASDHVDQHPASLVAIRQWLHRGGRLWIRLDRVAPATAARVLGEDFPCTVVDRAELTQWQIHTGRPVADPDDPDFDGPVTSKDPAHTDTLVTFEPPVEMVRVLAPGVRPVHVVDGWPVSFWRRVGRGRVLFTTLGPRGWFRPRTAKDKGPVVSHPAATAWKESEPLRDLATAFFKRREESPLRPAEFASLVTGQVGYRVISRGVVAGVLGLFCGGIALAGWWLNRRDDLARLGWIVPAGAVVTAMLLLIVGHHGRLAATVAAAQFLEAAPGAPDAALSGLLAIYNPGGPFEPLGADHGGVFLPDHGSAAAASQGALRRMVWTDLDRWHWENLALTPGLHHAPFETSVRLDRPLSARITFDADGVVGKAGLGPFTDAADGLLAMPSRRNLAVRFHGAEGDFAAGPGDQLAAGQYLAAALPSAEQARRRDVYKLMLERPTWPRYPLRPMFLTWAAPLDLGLAVPEGTRQTGSALLAIPLQIERPQAGSTVTIPAPFLPFRSVTRQGLALLYDAERNDWAIGQARASRTLLRVPVPPELMPLRIVRATLDVDINAAGRELEIYTEVAGRRESLAKRHSPVGRFRFELDPVRVQPDAAGTFYLGLAINDAGVGSATWKVNDLQLTIRADILEK